MTLEEPFKNFDLPMFYTQVIIQNFRSEFKYPIANCYKELNTKCWSGNPEERPTFDEIVDILKNNEEFIIDGVDKDEFLDYVDLNESSERSFESEIKFKKITLSTNHVKVTE